MNTYQPLYSKPWELVFLATLVFFFLNCSTSNTPAIQYHQRAAIAEGAGKLKKAERLLGKLIRTDSAGVLVKRDAALVAMYQRKSSLAVNYIKQIPCGKGCQTELRIKINTLAGIRALYQSRRSDAVRHFRHANNMIKRYDAGSERLRSVVLCNLGVAILFDQGRNGAPDTVKTYKQIHKRDFERAQHYFSKALDTDGSNCIAQYNLELMASILQLPEGSSDRGYFKKNKISGIKSSFSRFGCVGVRSVEELDSSALFQHQEYASRLIYHEPYSLVLRSGDLERGEFSPYLEDFHLEHPTYEEVSEKSKNAAGQFRSAVK
ncbi:MAG: hypothetical protein AAFZ15_15375 [Bacteroidota bacterium]